MIVVGYVRVSTEEQAREGVSLEVQESKIRAWHELNGGGRELVLFRDEARSGCRMDRKGLVAALAAAEAGGKGSALVAYSMSRVARSTTGMLETAERLEKAGCDLVSLTERIDTSSATGKMVFRLLAVLAEFERDLISDRTTAAMALKRSRGERVSRYDRVPEAACRRARELRAEGWSLRSIGDRLRHEGFAPVGGGASWVPKVVRDMVRRAA